MDVDAQLLKERAQGFQDRGEFETALPLMLASVQKRENSHTLCLSLSALGFLYIDMLKFKDAEHVAQRMLAEAHRYDTRNQKRIAKEILKEAVKENNFGFVHGDTVQITMAGDPELGVKSGVLFGRCGGGGHYRVRCGPYDLLVPGRQLTKPTPL